MNLFTYLKEIKTDEEVLKGLIEELKINLPYALVLDQKDSLIYIDYEYIQEEQQGGGGQK